MKNSKIIYQLELLLLICSVMIPSYVKATGDFKTISIANPDNPSEGITIMDRNLGATSNEIWSKDSFGYHYQRGNNYGFPQGCFSAGCSDNVTETSINVDSGGAIWNEIYNNSGYYGTKFIKAYYIGYREDGNYHNGLRGGTGDNPNNNWGSNQTNPEDRQGPCPDGYHVPSAGERGLLVKYWGNTYAKNNLINGGDGLYYISGDVAADFNIYFKLPFAGLRGEENALIGAQGFAGSYWSSSPNGNAYPDEGIGERRIHTFNTYGWLSGIPIWKRADADNGLSVRCFKNTYEPETVENIKTITLKQGLNAFSTPAIIKSISFSNYGNNVSLFTMKNGKWEAITVNNDNIRTTITPLNGYLIRNNNFSDITMTIEYDTDNSDSLVISKELDAGWNFLGITSTDNPFKNIASTTRTLILDLTNGKNTNLIELGKTFINTTKLVLGKAYAVFINNPGTYGGINNYGRNNYQCASMDSANVTHTIKNGIITFKWDEIQGDFVQISFDATDDGRGYMREGTVNMKDKKFDYKIRKSGEYKFLFTNGCKNFYYTVNANTSEVYSNELREAYGRAYIEGIISESSIDDVNLYNSITNLELADIMNKYAKNVLGLQANTSLVCDFGNLSSYMQGYDEETLNKYQEILTESCQLGLIPRDEIANPARLQDTTKAIFGTALSRALWGNQNEGGEPYYSGHLNALKTTGIMKNIENPEYTYEIKGYVLSTLMRAIQN